MVQMLILKPCCLRSIYNTLFFQIFLEHFKHPNYLEAELATQMTVAQNRVDVVGSRLQCPNKPKLVFGSGLHMQKLNPTCPVLGDIGVL